MAEKTLLERMAAETCKSFTGPLYGHPHTCPEQGKKVHQFCYPCKLRAALAEEGGWEYAVVLWENHNVGGRELSAATDLDTARAIHRSGLARGFEQSRILRRPKTPAHEWQPYTDPEEASRG